MSLCVFILCMCKIDCSSLAASHSQQRNGLQNAIFINKDGEKKWTNDGDAILLCCVVLVAIFYSGAEVCVKLQKQ